MIKVIVGYTTAITVLPKVDSGPNTNGHEYVDLGLPSGTLWATMNVGATSPTEYGNYYMYGMGSKTYDSADTPYDGIEDPLDLTKDTARQTWGGDWHMPTQAQLEELTANTTYQWVTDYQGSGVNGRLMTDKTNSSKVLFFPACGYCYNGGVDGVDSYGYYWSSSLFSSYVQNSYYLTFYRTNVSWQAIYSRSSGYPVRGVLDE